MKKMQFYSKAHKSEVVKCSKCGGICESTILQEYNLDTIGIPNVWLLNINEYRCSKCHNKSIILPYFGELIIIVVQAIIFKNDSFTIQELQLLNKFFKLSQKDFAKRVGTSEKTVSFWFNGRTRISPAYGLKIRRFFIEEFAKYLYSKKDEYRSVSVKLSAVLHELKREEEFDYKKYLKKQAKLAIQNRLVFQQAGCDDDVPTFKIPHSHSFLQLRNA
ncbi:MAG: helix-turn-helix transcriptional regulator [Deltaproteobacteria bacterium]|nr:helix-turn-helix transcriptional regulator [Deltaproteobacteria bacterium]MBI2975037.1 helix-turn-helix transcriptional regulator [Deltaproteobacteria bacterium]